MSARREPADAAAQVLAAALEQGAFAEALVDGWDALAEAPQTAGLMAAAAERLHPGEGVGVLSRPGALTLAVLTESGGLQADAAFLRRVGDPRADAACQGLVRRARKAGAAAAGLAAGAETAPLSILALPGAAAAGWRAALARRGWAPPSAGAVVLAILDAAGDDAAEEAGRALGLTAAEARLVAALQDCATLEDAARQVGVSRHTAKDTLALAVRRTGFEGAPALMAAVRELAFGDTPAPRPTPERLAEAWGLSGSESRVAVRLAAGETPAQAASALSLSVQTVETYRRQVFAKVGVGRARALGRMAFELAELDRLARAGGVGEDEPRGLARLRLLRTAEGRRVAVQDYGPASGRLTLVGHGYTSGGRAPPPLIAALAAQGRRGVVVHRPGFGLTDPAAGRGQAETAARDALMVAEALGGGPVDVLARDGVAWVFTLAEGWPEALGRVVLLNPRRPANAGGAGGHVISAMTQFLARHPRSIATFAEMLRRQSRPDILLSVMKRLSRGVEADRGAIADPATAEFLVRDVLALTGRGVAGFVEEHRLYAEGWRPPAGVDARAWTIAYGDAFAGEEKLACWAPLGCRIAPLAGAGWLAPFTHADALAALFDGAGARAQRQSATP